jgi:DNA-binding transcriptional LysR family regulator
MDLNEMAVFVRVVQAGSFTQAARLMGSPKSTVSAKVSSLERRLGVSLLQRTTRRLHLTEAGDAFFRHCAQALASLEEAEQFVTAAQAEPQGLLRVTAPVDVGTTLLPGLLTAFLARYPKVKVELVLTARVVDLVGEGVDIAVRASPLADSSLLARKAGSTRFSAVAAPSYVAKAGKPSHPRDLAQHACLRFSKMRGDGWELQSGDKRARVAIDGPISADDLAALRELVLAGHGVALLPTFLTRDAIREKRLVQLLDGWHTRPEAVYLVHPASRFPAPKVKAFLQLAVETFEKALA